MRHISLLLIMLLLGGGAIESIHFDYENLSDRICYPVDVFGETCQGASVGLKANRSIGRHGDWRQADSYTLADGRDADDSKHSRYTEKRRQRVAKERAKRIEKAQKANAQRRADYQAEQDRKNKQAQKAKARMQKEKAEREQRRAEARLYNEI